MNLLDLFQLGQCRGDLSNWWESMFAMEVKLGRISCKDRKVYIEQHRGVCKDLFLPGGLGMLSGIKHLQG